MLNFLRENLGLILTLITLLGLILGGIYYVETSLANQVKVID